MASGRSVRRASRCWRGQFHRYVVARQFIHHRFHPANLAGAALLGQFKNRAALRQAVIEQIWNRRGAADAVVIPDRKIQARVNEGRNEMHHQVGRTAGRRMNADAVFDVGFDQFRD